MTTAGPTAGRRELVLIGGGEQAQVVLDAARAGQDWSVVGFVDPDAHSALQAMGIAWLGNDDAAAAGLRGRNCVLAVGGIAGAERRMAIARHYETEGVIWARVVHPRAVVAAGSTVSPGATILAGAVVNPGASVGPHCIVNTGAIVEHDVELHPFAHIGPGAVVGGGTTIGKGAYVGLGARVRDHLHVGAGAIVGMGAVVVSDVPVDTVVVGVPARPIRTASHADD